MAQWPVNWIRQSFTPFWSHVREALRHGGRQSIGLGLVTVASTYLFLGPCRGCQNSTDSVTLHTAGSSAAMEFFVNRPLAFSEDRKPSLDERRTRFLAPLTNDESKKSEDEYRDHEVEINYEFLRFVMAWHTIKEEIGGRALVPVPQYECEMHARLLESEAKRKNEQHLQLVQALSERAFERLPAEGHEDDQLNWACRNASNSVRAMLEMYARRDNRLVERDERREALHLIQNSLISIWYKRCNDYLLYAIVFISNMVPMLLAVIHVVVSFSSVRTTLDRVAKTSNLVSMAIWCSVVSIGIVTGFSVAASGKQEWFCSLYGVWILSIISVIFWAIVLLAIRPPKTFAGLGTLERFRLRSTALMFLMASVLHAIILTVACRLYWIADYTVGSYPISWAKLNVGAVLVFIVLAVYLVQGIFVRQRWARAVPVASLVGLLGLAATVLGIYFENSRNIAYFLQGSMDWPLWVEVGFANLFIGVAMLMVLWPLAEERARRWSEIDNFVQSGGTYSMAWLFGIWAALRVDGVIICPLRRETARAQSASVD